MLANVTDSVRRPAVAGTFYPDDPDELSATVTRLLRSAPPRAPAKAIVAPHAGYVYSGPIAASAFRCLSPEVSRVVLLGPSHFALLRGVAQRAAVRGSPARDALRAHRPAQFGGHGGRPRPRSGIRRVRIARGNMSFPGRYFSKLADGRVRCEVCPRYCALHEGQRGMCFVRAREGDGVVDTTCGSSRGFRVY